MNLPSAFFLKLVCVIGFIGAFLAMTLMFSPTVWQMGAWYPAYLSLSTVLVVLCLGGLWLMRREAVWAYAILTIVNQGVYYLAHQWKPVILILPVVILATAFFYYFEMD